jgi:outer membrane lipase/esterase
MNPSLFPSRLRHALAVLAAALALSSCGGGGQVKPFVPTRVLALGDELSLLEADGRKHSINSFATKVENGQTVPDKTKLDCTLHPLWVQAVASAFALPFERCKGTATTGPSQMLAGVGAKVADLPAQLAAVTGAALNDNDLALVMIGMHDILELYGRYPATPREQLLDEARGRATALGNAVNSLAQAGPAVVVLTVPDIGLSPFALAQNTSTGDATRSKLIADLVSVFNNRMSVTLINDGRLIGLVYADLETQNNVKFPSTYALSNVVEAACLASAPLPGCTPDTLVTNATAAGHMWADSLRLGPTVQARLGTLAAFRAVNNPF